MPWLIASESSISAYSSKFDPLIIPLLLQPLIPNHRPRDHNRRREPSDSEHQLCLIEVLT